MKKLLLSLTVAGALAAVSAQGQTLIGSGINNGDFEMDAVGAAPAVWGEAASGGSIMVSSAYAQSGSNSLVIDSTGAGAWASPNAYQLFPAAPGDAFNLSGYMLLPTGAPITDASFGVLKIEFKDSGGANLEPASIGPGILDGAGQPFVGAISNRVDNTTTTGDWIHAEVGAVAPAGTVEVGFFLLNVNQGDAPSPIHFDSVTAIPEPATIALIGGLLALGLVLYRRRKRA